MSAPVVPTWDARETLQELSAFCTDVPLAEQLPRLSRERVGSLAAFISHHDDPTTMRQAFILVFGKGNLGVYDVERAKREIRQVLTRRDSAYENKGKRLEQVELFLRAWKRELEEHCNEVKNKKEYSF